jgi:hypothetical protein
MVTVNYFICDKSTNVYRMVTVNYFICDKSTNVYRMVPVKWNPYCVLSFNMGWWILAARDKLY